MVYTTKKGNVVKGKGAKAFGHVKQEQVHYEEERELISNTRYNGKIVEWKGRLGFIKPFYSINHPDAGKRGGKISLRIEEVEQGQVSTGATVNFLVYADSTGLGATECRVGGANMPAVSRVPTSSIYGKPVPTSAYGALPHGTRVDSRAKAKGGGRQSAVNHEQLAGRVHSILSEGLWPLVQEIAHLEETWPPEEIRKRVVRYLYKSSMADDLTQKSWQEAVKLFVEKAVRGYTSACAEKPWYDELDIIPVVGKAAGAIADACHTGFPRPRAGEAAEMAADLYVMILHKAKVDKVLSEAVQMAFPLDEKSQLKFNNALSRAYTPAYEAACASGPPGKGRGKGKRRATGNFERVEKFVSAWIGDALCRAWHGVADSEDVFTEDTLTEFFTGILAPNGSDDFTCIPTPLTEECGERSAEDWSEYLRPLCNDLLTKSYEPVNPGGKKRKRKSDEEGDEEEEAEEE